MTPDTAVPSPRCVLCPGARLTGSGRSAPVVSSWCPSCPLTSCVLGTVTPWHVTWQKGEDCWHSPHDVSRCLLGVGGVVNARTVSRAGRCRLVLVSSCLPCPPVPPSPCSLIFPSPCPLVFPSPRPLSHPSPCSLCPLVLPSPVLLSPRTPVLLSPCSPVPLSLCQMALGSLGGSGEQSQGRLSCAWRLLLSRSCSPSLRT